MILTIYLAIAFVFAVISVVLSFKDAKVRLGVAEVSIYKCAFKSLLWPLILVAGLVLAIVGD